MLAFFFICLWCFGIISPLFFYNEKIFLLMQPLLNQIFSTVCHQAHEKTISIEGVDIFVCSRCAGIYLGILVTSFVTLILIPPQKTYVLLLLTLLIMLIDVLLSKLGIYHYSKLAALLTGLFLGSALILFLVNELYYTKATKYYEK